MFIFAVVLFYWPDGGGLFLEHPNFTPADPLKTPEHIAPVWYFAPHYAILRAVPDKFLGVVAMVAAILILFVLPWIDRNRTRSIRYRSTAFKVNLFLFAAAFIGLGYLGTQPPTTLGTLGSQLLSVIYFGFFIAIFFISRRERTKPVPERLQ